MSDNLNELIKQNASKMTDLQNLYRNVEKSREILNRCLSLYNINKIYAKKSDSFLKLFVSDDNKIFKFFFM